MHAPGRAEISNPPLGKRIRKEQDIVLVNKTFDRVDQTFASRVRQESYPSSPGKAEKRSERRTIIHKGILGKETVVHE